MHPTTCRARPVCNLSRVRSVVCFCERGLVRRSVWNAQPRNEARPLIGRDLYRSYYRPEVDILSKSCSGFSCSEVGFEGCARLVRETGYKANRLVLGLSFNSLDAPQEAIDNPSKEGATGVRDRSGEREARSNGVLDTM